MAFLRHYANGSPIGAIELTEAVTIGRADENTIVLDDGTVSGRHALVLPRDELWAVVDNNSTNGVFFQGDKITEHTFNDGDIITIGTHEFEFVFELPKEFERTLKIKKSWIPGIYYTE
ncbi:FHA domain-containing protein [Aurantivibrio plasticivorans]